jgi:hypothetical protein
MLVLGIKPTRLLEDIQAMEEEHAGREPARYIEVEGTTLPSRKRLRGASEVAEDQEWLQKTLKMVKPPPKFNGKTMKALRDYNNGWETVFDAIPASILPDWGYRIRAAANGLEDRAQIRWRQERNASVTFPTSWAEFISWCKDTIEDADVRKGEALMSLATLKQDSTQAVRDLANAMELLEGEIGSLTEDERQGWTLFHALKPDLRDAVRRDLERITSRAQVLASAQRLEKTVAREKRETNTRSPAVVTKKTTYRSQAKIERVSPSPSKKARYGEEREKPPPFEGECHNCGKKGHRARDCRSRSTKQRDAPSSPTKKEMKGKAKESSQSKN